MPPVVVYLMTASLMCLTADYWIAAFSLVIPLMYECLIAVHWIVVYLMAGASRPMMQCLVAVCSLAVCTNVACLMAVLAVSLNTVC